MCGRSLRQGSGPGWARPRSVVALTSFLCSGFFLVVVPGTAAQIAMQVSSRMPAGLPPPVDVFARCTRVLRGDAHPLLLSSAPGLRVVSPAAWTRLTVRCFVSFSAVLSGSWYRLSVSLSGLPVTHHPTQRLCTVIPSSISPCSPSPLNPHPHHPSYARTHPRRHPRSHIRLPVPYPIYIRSYSPAIVPYTSHPADTRPGLAIPHRHHHSFSLRPPR